MCAYSRFRPRRWDYRQSNNNRYNTYPVRRTLPVPGRRTADPCQGSNAQDPPDHCRRCSAGIRPGPEIGPVASTSRQRWFVLVAVGQLLRPMHSRRRRKRTPVPLRNTGHHTKQCQVTCPHGGSAFLKRLPVPLTAALDIETTIRSSRIPCRSGLVCPPSCSRPPDVIHLTTAIHPELRTFSTLFFLMPGVLTSNSFM